MSCSTQYCVLVQIIWCWMFALGLTVHTFIRGHQTPDVNFASAIFNQLKHKTLAAHCLSSLSLSLSICISLSMERSCLWICASLFLCLSFRLSSFYLSGTLSATRLSYIIQQISHLGDRKQPGALSLFLSFSPPASLSSFLLLPSCLSPFPFVSHSLTLAWPLTPGPLSGDANGHCGEETLHSKGPLLQIPYQGWAEMGEAIDSAWPRGDRWVGQDMKY